MSQRRSVLLTLLVAWSVFESLGIAWLGRRGAGSPFQKPLLIGFGVVYILVIAVLLFLLLRKDSGGQD